MLSACKDLDMVVTRTQQLVTEYHEIRVAIARIESVLKALVDDVASLKTTIRDKVAGRDEFIIVRNQLWAGVGVIVIGVLSAFVTFIVKGGLRVAP